MEEHTAYDAVLLKKKKKKWIWQGSRSKYKYMEAQTYGAISQICNQQNSEWRKFYRTKNLVSFKINCKKKKEQYID